MNKEIAKIWVEELESGRWGQGYGQLGDGPRSRCCLGVLQEIAPKELHKNTLKSWGSSHAVNRWAGLSLMEKQELSLMNDDDSSGTYAGPIAYIKEHFLGDES